MNRSDDAAIRELITDLELKDKRFRMFQSIFMAVMALILVILVGGQFYVINQFQDQSAQRAAGIKKIAETSQRNTELSNQYLQCIARFFATTDRQSRVLTDLDNCVYEQNGQVIPGLDNKPTNSPQPAAAPSQGSTTINLNNPGLQILPNEQQPENTADPVPTVKPPVEILGIPVCVPFTSICVR